MWLGVFRCASAAGLLLIFAVTAAAQVPAEEPIGHFAVDARGAFARFPDTETVASGIQVTSADLPTGGLGIVVGAHVYPFRVGAVTVGLGGELLVARGSRTTEPATAAGPDGPAVNARLSALSPQVSLNFGSRDGWSYLSGGLGWSVFTAEREEVPLPDPEARSKTINYGGGARWFATKRFALSLDLRFYAIAPQPVTATRPALPRMTLMVMSGGIAFK